MQTEIEIACELAKTFEGFREKPYLCPAGVATIGFGSTRYLTGKAVTMQDKKISVDDAEDMLKKTMADCLSEALVICPNLSNHSENRKAAIADFIYNLGAEKFRKSTLKEKILNEDWDAVKVQLMRWVYAGAIVLSGLKRRREAEAALI